jgi:hypothetical protein
MNRAALGHQQPPYPGNGGYHEKDAATASDLTSPAISA